jgi:hypothetical protein
MNTEFLHLVPVPDDPEESLPKYSDPGRILVLVSGTLIDEMEVLWADSSASTFWMGEGAGCDYWVKEVLRPRDFGAPGYWVIEGITGTYIKGEYGVTEDEEEWEYKSVRPATFEDLDEML